MVLTNYFKICRQSTPIEALYDWSDVHFVPGQRGSKLLSIGGFNFVKNRATDLRTYWICNRKVRQHSFLHLLALLTLDIYFDLQFSAKCNARVTTELSKLPDQDSYQLNILSVSGTHTHEYDPKSKAVKSETISKLET